MRAHDLLAHLNLDRSEQIGMLRERDDDGARELGKIAGCGDLALVGQAVDVGEIGPPHAEMLCRLVHTLDERLLTAGDALGDHDCDVVGQLDDEDLQRDVSVINSPTFSQSLLGACSVASLEHTSLVSGVTVPAFKAWKAT